MTRLILVTALLVGCAGVKEIAEGIDRLCVVGRLSVDQADALNVLPWGKLNPALGEARWNDRVVNRDCSELLREIEGRD